MIKTRQLSIIPLAALLLLFSTKAMALYLAHADCWAGVTDGGIGFTSADCYFQQPGGDSWSSSASADLASGTVSGNAYTAASNVGWVGVYGGIEDVVTVEGMAAGDNAYLGAYLNVTGSLTGDPVDDQWFATADLELAPTDFSEENYTRVDFYYDGTTVTTDTTGLYGNYSGGNYEVIINSLSPTAYDITLYTWFTVPASDPYATVIAGVGAQSWPETTGVTSDIHGTLSLELLDGLTFTSESGVLLTETVVPVPPAVWLFGSGLLGLIGIARKKKV